MLVLMYNIVFSAILWTLGYKKCTVLMYLKRMLVFLWMKIIVGFYMSIANFVYFVSCHLFRFWKLRDSSYLLSWSVDNMPIAWRPLVQTVCTDHILTQISLSYIYIYLCLCVWTACWFLNVSDSVIQPSPEDTVLHIYKRRMGLTKRGGYDNETLSVSGVSINQTDTFTWSETTSFVKLIIPTALIQKTKVKKRCHFSHFLKPHYHLVHFTICGVLLIAEMCWQGGWESPTVILQNRCGAHF